MSNWLEGGWLASVEKRNSPNFGLRPITDVSLIVMHNISLPPGEFGDAWVEDFFLNQLDPKAHPYFESIANLKVSSHFFIRRDGAILQFVGCDFRAWHAGLSSWLGRKNCNDYSIGIELEGADNTPFETIQYESLWHLIDQLQGRYPIRTIAGHCHVSPGRKTDPGPFFNWSDVSKRYPSFLVPQEAA